VVPRLVRAHLDQAQPRLPSPADRHGLVERHLAVWAPAATAGAADRLTVHPDIAFALRISDRPGPVEPVLD